MTPGYRTALIFTFSEALTTDQVAALRYSREPSEDPRFSWMQDVGLSHNVYLLRDGNGRTLISSVVTAKLNSGDYPTPEGVSIRVLDNEIVDAHDPTRLSIYPESLSHWCSTCGSGKGSSPQDAPCVHCGGRVFTRIDTATLLPEFMDIPSSWAVQKHGTLDHDPRCSAPQTNGALLCDCDAVERAYTAAVAAATAG